GGASSPSCSRLISKGYFFRSRMYTASARSDFKGSREGITEPGGTFLEQGTPLANVTTTRTWSGKSVTTLWPTRKIGPWGVFFFLRSKKNLPAPITPSTLTHPLPTRTDCPPR